MINFDYPQSSEDYIHRIGRTGRSQKSGTSYAFFTTNNMRHASDLISVLRESNQEVSPQLIEMADLAKIEMNQAKNRKAAKMMGHRFNGHPRGGAKIPSRGSGVGNGGGGGGNGVGGNGVPQRIGTIQRGMLSQRGRTSDTKRGFHSRREAGSYGQSGGQYTQNRINVGIGGRPTEHHVAAGHSSNQANYHRHSVDTYGNQSYAQASYNFPPPSAGQGNYGGQGAGNFGQFNTQVPPPGYNTPGPSQCVQYPMTY